jgi:hypothetical protein
MSPKKQVSVLASRKKRLKSTLIFDKDGRLWLKQGKKKKRIILKKGYTLKKLIKLLLKKYKLKKLYVKRPKKLTQISRPADMFSVASGNGYMAADNVKKETVNLINNLKADQNRKVEELQKEIKRLKIKEDIAEYDLEEPEQSKIPESKSEMDSKHSTPKKQTRKEKFMEYFEEHKKEFTVPVLKDIAKRMNIDKPKKGRWLKKDIIKALLDNGATVKTLETLGDESSDEVEVKPKRDKIIEKETEKEIQIEPKIDTKDDIPELEAPSDNEEESTSKSSDSADSNADDEDPKKQRKVRIRRDPNISEDDFTRLQESERRRELHDEKRNLEREKRRRKKEEKAKKLKRENAPDDELIIRTDAEDSENNSDIQMYNKSLKGKGMITRSGTYVSKKDLIESENAKPLYNDEIDEAMEQYPDFGGTIARDEINKILDLVKPQSRIGWIMNLDKSTGKGTHWVACLVDARPTGSLTAEYYDSFGRRCPNDILRGIMKVVKKMDSPHFLKFKENRITFQNVKTDNCGYFSVMFLVDRFNGLKFPVASHFNTANQQFRGETDLARFKKNFAPFSYI